jgi:hypothetical protein
VSLGGSTELTVPQGDGSGLNADKVDGNHASAFADVGHIHDSRYYTESEADSNFAVSGHDHNHNELTNVGSSDHHSRYTDSEAVVAVNAQTSLAVDITGDADTVDGQNYSDIQNWVNNNADVPNADHANHADTTGDADTVDGLHASELGLSASEEEQLDEKILATGLMDL